MEHPAYNQLRLNESRCSAETFSGLFANQFLISCLKALSIVAILALQIYAVAAQEAKSRVALVIGNGAYENVPLLKNPRNDSSDLATELEAIGFDVILHADQSQANMLDTLRIFQRKASGAEIALIYYAGHGIEINRRNYLIPIDAVLETDSDVNFETVPLDTMIFAAEGATRLSIVIVDACRDNPFAVSMKTRTASRSVGRGLSAVEPTRNTLVAYAAKEGTTAADGAGRNSPYAGALINALRRPNVEVGLMMRQVRDEVLAATGGQQEPFVYGSLSAEQIFLNSARGLTPVIAETPLEPEELPASEPDIGLAEVAFWRSVSQSSDASELESYIAKYPEGIYAELALVRIKKLRQIEPSSPDRFLPLVPEVQSQEVLPERGLDRSEIIEVQERLSVLGYSLGTADGIAGRRTKAAIREFEAGENMPQSGEPVLSILIALRERVADAEVEKWRASLVPRERVTSTKPRRTVTAPSSEPQAGDSDASAGPSPGAAQFCASNSQCGTQQCRLGSHWRKNTKCRYCPIYVQRCQ